MRLLRSSLEEAVDHVVLQLPYHLLAVGEGQLPYLVEDNAIPYPYLPDGLHRYVVEQGRRAHLPARDEPRRVRNVPVQVCFSCSLRPDLKHVAVGFHERHKPAKKEHLLIEGVCLGVEDYALDEQIDP